MNGGDGDDAPPTGAVGAAGQGEGVTGVGRLSEDLVDTFLGASYAQGALEYGSAPATGASDSMGAAQAWESIALEGDASAKRFKMDTSGAAHVNHVDLGAGSVALPPPLSMARSASAVDSSPASSVLHQHLRQQQAEQDQRQRALQAHAQQQRPPLVAGQPETYTDAGSSAALYGTHAAGQQMPASAYPSVRDLAFTIPMPHRDAAQDQAVVSQANIALSQPPQQNQQQQQSVAAALAGASPLTSTASHPCVVCQEEGGVFSCQGGCGLHAHPKCVGEDVIVQFSVGQLCGNCYIMQQDRNLKEDLTKGDAARLSVRRAILWVNLETNNPINFEKFGHMTSLRLWEIGRVAGYPIKPFAEKFVEPYLQRWMREKLAYVDKWQLSVHEVFTLLLGLYGLKCACISHDRLAQVIGLVKARNLSVTDYIGWHPAIESPNVRCSAICPICGIRNTPELEVCARCQRRLQFPSVYMKYASAILAAFYSEQVGIPLGTTVLEVFAHTNTVRQAYKGLAPVDADGIPWPIFTDQLRMIFGLLDIMSDFGSLQLNPDLFGPEVAILFNASYVHRAILQTDFEMVGRTLQCMKLFGGARVEAQRQLIGSCEQFLLLRQMPNGSWCRVGGSSVDQYKATVACAKALATPKFRGYGPPSADCLRLLEKWASSFKSRVVGEAVQAQQQSPAASSSTDAAEVKVLASGAVVQPGARTNLKRLEALYKRQLVPGKSTNVMEYLVSTRMRSIASAKKLAVERVDEEDDQVSTPEDEQSSAKSEDAKIDLNDAVKSEVVRKVEVEAGDTVAEPSRSKTKKDTDVKVKSEDEEALTSRSLSEDLEIFDGLKFEDGDVIDLHHHASMVDTNADEDDGDAHENVDGDAEPGNEVDADEIGDDDMYDDDNEENDDGSESIHSGDEVQGQPETVEESGETDDVPLGIDQVPDEPLDDSAAPLL